MQLHHGIEPLRAAPLTQNHERIDIHSGQKRQSQDARKSVRDVGFQGLGLQCPWRSIGCFMIVDAPDEIA
jgi:hypothetical protein